ncbi:hypothetical protein [Brucella tritici]|uniref:hypothetical protein n=1 Tax=Brucella tritici TaxID=94626 RepID=UPI0015911862|nr:hypothetical protein [Brucella tritici]
MIAETYNASCDEGRPVPRPGAEVMRSTNLAAIQPSRLSGSRAFMNRMLREKWDINIERFDVNADADGTVVYSIKTPTMEFSFIGFSRPPSRTARTGRIIGQAWDMMGALIEGRATEADVESASEELPKLYAGRATPNTLIWCRSNRSMRVFDQTLDALASGHQPRIEDLSRVCYLMRNTGLDGNGTFGTRSFPSLGKTHPLGGVLQAQMLTAYMMREYSCDLVERLARLKSDKAVPLDAEIRRYLGVGNGSALGLIFFIHRHPRLINAWLGAREAIIARVRGLQANKGDARVAHLLHLIETAINFRKQDRMVYEALTSSEAVAADLEQMAVLLKEFYHTGLIGEKRSNYPFDALVRYFQEGVKPESMETLLSLFLELLPEETDALFASIEAPDEFSVSPNETLESLAVLIQNEYSWALAADMSAPDAYKYIWYKSETAEEPRRGAREEVPEALDLGLDICGGLQSLMSDIASQPQETTVARFLLKHPEHRYLIARVQGMRGQEYHTPQVNINADTFVPIDLVRLMNCGIHGIDKTRDFLNRNLRGVLYHGAPTRDDIRAGYSATWFYPAEPVQ